MTRAAARLVGLAAALAAASALLSPGFAAEPRSAIPWLSESIEIEGTPPPPSRAKAGRARAGGDVITVTPLGDIRRDAVGLLPPERTGFARALWGDADAAEVRELILGHPDQGSPEARALFHRLLLAEADPPKGDGRGDSVLVARIDRLLAIGALEEAMALIERAGPETPELFRRWFDAGLLLEESAEPCAALRQNPALSPTLPARVFCLARGGDWNAAEITLTLGQQVGSIPEAEEALLARFLDPELFEEEAEPPLPEPLTPLDFLMREAVGLSRPPGALPLAFLHPDLDLHAPMRVRIDAAERLVLSGAVAYPELFAAYRSGAPAASGGIWGRAAAVQALDAGLDAGDPEEVGGLLHAADAALAERGLRVALAREYAGRLATFDPGALRAEARPAVAELLLLAGAADAARRAAGPAAGDRFAGLLAVAGAGPAPASVEDDRLAAALAGLAGGPPRDDREARLAGLLDSGRQGEAILAALDLARGGAMADPPALRTALATLVRAGQEASARRIALETLLAGAR
jgi:hypothetical protein